MASGERRRTQVLIIGSGIGGLTAALTLAEAGFEVTVLCAGDKPDDGNTALAQGGIVYTSPQDEPRLLEEDILTAGWRHNYQRGVRYLCRKGPQVVKSFLIDAMDVPFAKDDAGELALTREGGHRVPRILYCADHTGRSIMRSLLEVTERVPNITLLTRRTCLDLLTSHHNSSKLEYKYHLVNQCLGAYVFNEETSRVDMHLADYVVLATGGLGHIYLHSTNAPASIGSGLAMASRALAKIMNAEYVQFHPTALFHRSQRRFLISEAVRGEGATLVNAKGERFMTRYDQRAELAPRDIVTRAIMEEMLHSGEDCVFLDATQVKHDLRKRFPTIHQKCLEIGVDIERQPIPVVPAAHYFCGGVLVDARGRTTLERLYAVGECSCTGVHGANRLASTSLLEGLLWGWTAGQDIARRFRRDGHPARRLFDSLPDWVGAEHERNEDPALTAQDWATIRHTMWNYVGVSRTTPRLKRAFEDLRDMNKRLHDFYKETPISKPLVDLFHGCQAAYVVTVAVMLNKRSQGCHFRAS